METVTFHLDGREVVVPGEGSLLDALRMLGRHGVKDGCAPQGQCGCCTVLVDGEPRVSCVTPLRRVGGRSVTTFDGLDEAATSRWGTALVSTGASQCGFCTPGIAVRLEWLRRRGSLGDPAAVHRALAAHLCRCTGWQTLAEAASLVAGEVAVELPRRDGAATARRAGLEGGVTQRIGLDTVGGRAGFAADTAPADALVALMGADGEWVVGATWAEARSLAGKVQGRATTVEPHPPLEVPPGEWAVELRTGWVEPGYLELDASWCTPGGDPASPLANGGAFGGKAGSPLPAVARRLSDQHGRAVLAAWTREDVVRHGPKRPPVAVGVDHDGRGVMRVVRTPGIEEAVAAVAPGLIVQQVEVPGPPTSLAIRGAGWVEAAVVVAAATGEEWIRSPSGAVARAEVGGHGELEVTLRCGDPLDEVVLRSYVIGAAHMGLGWVLREGLAVDDEGVVHDLTIRSFGMLKAAEMPHVEVHVDEVEGPAVNGSDAVFAAVALAAWRALGLPPAWPTGLAWPP